MHFEPNTIYHIYNQGNNRQPIFFREENYLYFLRKMRQYLLPYGDLLCYCLMPNHFHWLMYVREPSVGVAPSHPDAGSHAPGRQRDITTGAPSSHPGGTSEESIPTRTLNDSIGILLRSYAQAINKQENRSGALFREETKAKDGWDDPYVSPSDPNYGVVWKNWDVYGASCFNYIHFNPVRAGLVPGAEDWPFSSALDYAGKRKGFLCNQELARALLGLP